MTQVVLTPEAENDLVQIWQFTAVMYGVDQADDYLSQLATGMRQLTEYPLLGSNYDHVLSGYRRLIIERHAIFYKTNSNEILVIRVLHQDMDAPRTLNLI